MEITTKDVIYILLAILTFYILIDFIWLKPKIQRSESRDIIKRLKNSKDIKDVWNKNSKGIIMNLDNDTFESGLFSIACLKKVGCNLPITISGDFNDHNKKILKSMNIKIIESTSQIDLIISSQYREILYISPGVIFLDNPINLFVNNVYNQTGAIFWKTGNTGFVSSTLIRQIIPYNIPDNPILMKNGNKCQDPRVMLIDKAWHLKGLGKANVLKHEHVDQSEIFWIAFELAGEPYHFYTSGEGINGMDSFNIDNNLCWMVVTDTEKLDVNTGDSPLDYFRKNFQETNGIKIPKKEILNESQKNLLNEYRKVDFHIKEIV